MDETDLLWLCTSRLTAQSYLEPCRALHYKLQPSVPTPPTLPVSRSGQVCLTPVAWRAPRLQLVGAGAVTSDVTFHDNGVTVHVMPVRIVPSVAQVNNHLGMPRWGSKGTRRRYQREEKIKKKRKGKKEKEVGERTHKWKAAKAVENARNDYQFLHRHMVSINMCNQSACTLKPLYMNDGQSESMSL